MADFGFDPRPYMVRADFFTDDPRMKWKYTKALDMSEVYYLSFVHAAVSMAWKAMRPRMQSLVIVVLEPYHHQSCPVMLTPAQRDALVDIGKTVAP